MAENNGAMAETSPVAATNNGAPTVAVTPTAAVSDDAASRIKREPDNAAPAEDRRQSGGTGGGGRYRKRSRSRSPRRNSMGGPMKRDRRDDGRSGGSNDRMVYISNLPYETRWMELKNLIVEKCGEISFVEILETPQGKSKGCAVVEFKDRESAAKCCSDAMNRTQIKDRYIVCKEIRDPAAFFRKVKEDTGIDFLASGSGRGLLSGMGGGGGRVGGGGGRGDHMGGGRGGGAMGLANLGAPPVAYDTYGLSPAFLRQLHIDGPLCNRVFVANLAYNVQSGRIYEVFSLAGEVKLVDLQMDKEGKSKGLAVVEFKHPIEAVQAVSMLHDQKLAGRSLIVKMDRHEKQQEKRPGELPRDLDSVGMGLGANGAPLTNVAQLLSQVGAAPPSAAGSALTGGAPSIFDPMSMNAMKPPPRVFLDEPRGVNDPYGVLPPPSMYDRRDGNYASGPGQLGGPASYQQPSMPQSGLGGGGGYSASYATPADRNVGGGGGTPYDLGRGGGGGLDAATRNMLAAAVAAEERFGGRLPPAPPQLGGTGAPVDYSDHGRRQGGGGGGPPGKSIVIRNLPYDYTWQMVRDRLRDYGNIEFADIINPGVARVRFGRVDEAERARASLNGATVEGRPISVEFAYDNN